MVVAARELDGEDGGGIILGGTWPSWVGYSTIFETMTRGKTRARWCSGPARISDDGPAGRFRAGADPRGLTGRSNRSTVGAPIGLITSLHGEGAGDGRICSRDVCDPGAGRRSGRGTATRSAGRAAAVLGWAEGGEWPRFPDTDRTQRRARQADTCGRFNELSPRPGTTGAADGAAITARVVGPRHPPGHGAGDGSGQRVMACQAGPGARPRLARPGRESHAAEALISPGVTPTK